MGRLDESEAQMRVLLSKKQRRPDLRQCDIPIGRNGWQRKAGLFSSDDLRLSL